MFLKMFILGLSKAAEASKSLLPVMLKLIPNVDNIALLQADVRLHPYFIGY